MAKQKQIPVPARFHEQAEGSWTLPAHWYTDADIFEQEKQQIFFRNWWYVGAESRVSASGEFLCSTVVDQDIFIIRGKDGVLRGFYNVCRHRAHRLLEGEGCKKSIVCPYHGWSYETEGGFRGARGVDTQIDFNGKDFWPAADSSRNHDRPGVRQSQ